jgi:hypothetical protein
LQRGGLRLTFSASLTLNGTRQASPAARRPVTPELAKSTSRAWVANGPHSPGNRSRREAGKRHAWPGYRVTSVA